MVTRIRPTNANYLSEIFSLHEKRVMRNKPKDINPKKLTKVKRAIDGLSLEPSENSHSIGIFEDFSPFTAHLLQNRALKEICQEIFGVKLLDSNLTRYHYFLPGDTKTILYINMKPMMNIEEGITVIDDMGKSIHIDESGQIEGTYCSCLNVDGGKRVEVIFKYFIGFLREE